MRRSTKRSIIPELTLQSVWNDNIASPPETSNGTCKNLSDHLRHFNTTDQEGILNELLQIETESLRRNNRLRYIRKKIMDLIDRKYSAKYLHHILDESDELSSKPDNTQISLERALADCNIQISVLQAYIQGKYGDANNDDWFDQYDYLSERYHAALMDKTSNNGKKQIYFDGVPMMPTKENFQICRKQCLDSFVSQEFILPHENTNWLSRLVHAFKRKSIWRKLVS